MTKILVLGSVNMDLVVQGPRLPAQGETVLGGAFFQSLGGKGANQAVAAARAARERVTFLAAVGDDAFGREALEALAREPLDVRFVRTIAGEASGVALIVVDSGGENQIVVAPGANRCLAPAHVDELPEELLAGAGVFLASLETPLPAVRRGLERARAAGLRTILNPAPADRAILEAGMLELVDVLTPNESEAAALLGVEVGPDAGNSSTVVGRLRGLGCGAVVVTLGPAGALVVTREESLLVPTHRVQAVDSTAAGDAFNGALAVALSEGKPLVEAVGWANAAGALAVTLRGAQGSLPTRANVERLAGG